MITFFCERFFSIQKTETDSEFRIRFLNFYEYHFNTWNKEYLFDFAFTDAFFPPQFLILRVSLSHFFIRNHFPSVVLCDEIDIKRCGISLRIFWSIWKFLLGDFHLLKRPSKYTWKCIFDVKFPRNRFKFSIISNDFWSSTTQACQIQISFSGVENPKNPGIQPRRM